MSRRLSPDRSSSAPVLSLRLPAELSSALEDELGHLRDLIAATPDLASLAPDRSDLARVLLGEALAARRAARRAAREAKLSVELGNLTLHASSLSAVAEAFSPSPPPSFLGSTEPPCDRCGEGTWRDCSGNCGDRVRECLCTAEEGRRCTSCLSQDRARAAISENDLADIAPSPVVPVQSPEDALRARINRVRETAPEDAVSWPALGRATGVHASTLHRFASGEHKTLKPAAVAALEQVLARLETPE